MIEMPYNNDEILVKSIRDGLIDEVHSGFVVFGNLLNQEYLKGFSGDYPFYLRSCAKPLQASLLIDFGMDKFYDMTDEEIALCSASHAGEKVHTDILKGLIDKIGVDESYLKCPASEPLSKTRKAELLSQGAELSKAVYNNCSGKHTMMLGICKMKGWDLVDYNNIEHPLQKAIIKKVYELCDVKSEYPVTRDGCGVPIVSMPLKNILKGFLNLFCDKKYKKITDAFLQNPYLIGGEDRTDTKVIQSCKNVVCKVGAGGLCVAVNIETQEGCLVKISDSNMKAREFAVFEILRKHGWTDIVLDKSVKTMHGDNVGFYEVSI